jgi:methylenetetrahydrofolate dehydrogenase (NADP+)/methenyltetrahydrofolate cyclohydrolase
MQIISGKELSAKLKQEMAAQAATFEARFGRLPKLSVILAGNDAGSVSYVAGKAKACKEVGILNETIVFDENIEQNQLLQKIAELNEDEKTDGILVQLPLPKHIDEKTVIAAIERKKDVDGFHPLNTAALWSKTETVLPCTPKGIIKLLKSANIEIGGKKAVVIGRSNIVGLPVSKLLLDENATVTIAHSRTKNLAETASDADILIVAIGKPKFVTAEMVKKGAVVVDVGVNRDESTGKLCGDVDFDSVAEKTSFITKVPGGVGPMTICCLIENTIECFLKNMEQSNP